MNKPKETLIASALVAAALITMPYTATGQTIYGGSKLISQSDLLKIQVWQGGGVLDLWNVFSHTAGDGLTSEDFHNAVQLDGPTITVISVVAASGLSAQLVGGYNPYAWNTSQTYNVTNDDSMRTAYLFNLTQSFVQQQALSSVANNYGRLQTYNNVNYGPTFGGGHDLMVDGSLNSGYAVPFSYISTGLTNITGSMGSISLIFDTIEVFALSDPNAKFSVPGGGGATNSRSGSGGPTQMDPGAVYGSVPEPTSVVAAAIGLCTIGVPLTIRRRLKQPKG